MSTPTEILNQIQSAFFEWMKSKTKLEAYQNIKVLENPVRFIKSEDDYNLFLQHYSDRWNYGEVTRENIIELDKKTMLLKDELRRLLPYKNVWFQVHFDSKKYAIGVKDIPTCIETLEFDKWPENPHEFESMSNYITDGLPF